MENTVQWHIVSYEWPAHLLHVNYYVGIEYKCLNTAVVVLFCIYYMLIQTSCIHTYMALVIKVGLPECHFMGML